MSKYIQGIVDYIPQIQPYKPDLNFVAKVLETKEAQYQAGYDKLSGLYGTLLQSPMLRTDNNELRNDFFNRISSEIQKISSLDLSLAQNVQAASQVFQPLIEDDYIMKDMAYTKQAYNALQQGEDLKNCIEKECRGKYWQGGIRAIHYQMEDFMNAERDATLNFRAPEYVPATNIAQDATKFITDSKLKMTTVTASPDGRYRITNTNGTQMIPYLNQLLYTTFGNDQASIDYFNTQAYLMRKDEIAAGVEKFGSKEAAEQAYLADKLKIINQRADEEKRLVDAQEKRVNTKTGAAEDHIRNNGVDLSNPKDKAFTQEYLQSLVDKIVIGKSKEKVEEQKEIVDPEITPTLDLDAQRFRVDTAVANELMGGTLSSVAENYAMSTMEQEVTEDKYALAAQEHSYRMALEGSRQRFEMKKLAVESQIKDQQRRDMLRDDLLKMELKGEIEAITDENGNITGYKKRKDNSLLDPNPNANTYKTFDPNNPESAQYTEEDLKASDDKHVSDNLQGMVGEQYNVASQLHLKLKSFAKASVGDRVNGIEVTSDLKDEAQNYIDVIFKDYLDNNGNLVSMDEFSKRDSDKAFKMRRIDQINAMLGTLGKTTGGAKHFSGYSAASTLFGLDKDQKLMASMQELTNKTAIYERDLEDRLHNYNTVHNAIVTGAANEISKNLPGEMWPEWARNFIINGNKAFISEDEFKRNFKQKAIADIKSGRMPLPLYGSSISGRYGYADFPGFESQESRDYYVDIESTVMAEKAWNQYKEQFTMAYNRADGGVPVSDLRSLKSGYTLVNPDDQQGSFVQANPMIIDIDAAHPLSLGAQDANAILRLTQQLSMTKGSGLQVGGGSALDLESGNLEDVVDSQSMNRLNAILSDIASGNTTDSRARFSLAYHPIVGGTKGKVGFTLFLDPNYVASNQGSEKSPDVFRGYGPDAERAVHIIMDEDQIKDLDIYKRNQDGIYSRLYNGEPFTIDTYKDYGGEFTYQKSPYSNDGSILTSGYTWVYDDITGEKQKNYFTDITPKGVTPDNIVASWAPLMQSQYEQNMQIEDLKRLTKKENGQLITDPAQLQAYLNR